MLYFERVLRSKLSMLFESSSSPRALIAARIRSSLFLKNIVHCHNYYVFISIFVCFGRLAQSLDVVFQSVLILYRDVLLITDRLNDIVKKFLIVYLNVFVALTLCLLDIFQVAVSWFQEYKEVDVILVFLCNILIVCFRLIQSCFSAVLAEALLGRFGRTDFVLYGNIDISLHIVDFRYNN